MSDVRRGEGPDGRWVEVAVEVPATPEQVWRAIATGPGISAWFVPTDVEPGEGGTVTQHHGEGIDAPPSRIVAWEPGKRLKLEDPEWQPTPGSPAGTLATEYLVEARSGGTCIVRLVASGFGEGAEWDKTFEGNAVGWQSALETLRLYLTHFDGQPLAHADAWGEAHGDRDEAAHALRRATSVDGLKVGDPVRAAAPVPELEGVVEAIIGGQVIVRATKPTTGLVFIATGGPGEETFAMVRMSLFGPDAEQVAGRIEPQWQAWLAQHLALTRPAYAEIEVPATPEQVWDAIATADGISSWFMAVDALEPRAGGALRWTGVDDASTVTTYEAPRRLVFEERSQVDPDRPETTLAYEWLVEARAGGTCVVRVVTSGFGDGAAWDDFRTSMEGGWGYYLKQLAVVLEHFPGERARTFEVTRTIDASRTETWTAMQRALEDDPVAGRVVLEDRESLTLLLDPPARGLALFGVYDAGTGTTAVVRQHRFDEATADRAAWERWLEQVAVLNV